MSYTHPDPHPPLCDSVSKLQDTTAQIRDIAHYVCDVAAGLAREETSLNALTHETLHELGLTLNGNDSWTTSSDHLGAEEVYDPARTRKLVEI